jgi:3-oxoacyl-[acyl-carrier-protein] synthase III
MPVASTGVYVATAIGATNAFWQAVCCSSFYMECQWQQLIPSGRYKKVLLIGADKKCLQLLDSFNMHLEMVLVLVEPIMKIRTSR